MSPRQTPQPTPPERLATAVQAARLGRGLSQRKAAQAADIALLTWRSMEAGSTVPRPLTLAAAERVLHWPQGAAQAILDGGDPPETIDPKPKPDDSTASALARIEAQLARIETKLDDQGRCDHGA